MIRFYKYIIVVICFLTSFSSYSQTKVKHFSSDSSMFFQEMEEFLTYSRKQDGAIVMDEFSWTWFGGKFSDKQREGVYKVSNLMLKKRKKAFFSLSLFIYFSLARCRSSLLMAYLFRGSTSRMHLSRCLHGSDTHLGE